MYSHDSIFIFVIFEILFPFFLLDSEKEIKAMYKQFRKDCPDGYIPREEFRNVLKQMGIVDVLLQDLIFNAFDQDKDDEIRFEEFIIGLWAITKGTSEEKLTCNQFLFLFFFFDILSFLQKKKWFQVCFRMLDVERTGFLEKEKLSEILESLQRLVGPLVGFSGKKFGSVQQFVDYFFDVVDLDKDGKISSEDYKEGSMKNPDIFLGLQLFGPHDKTASVVH